MISTTTQDSTSRSTRRQSRKVSPSKSNETDFCRAARRPRRSSSREYDLVDGFYQSRSKAGVQLVGCVDDLARDIVQSFFPAQPSAPRPPRLRVRILFGNIWPCLPSVSRRHRGINFTTSCRLVFPGQPWGPWERWRAKDAPSDPPAQGCAVRWTISHCPPMAA